MFRLQAFTFCGQTFQNCLATLQICNSLTDLHLYQISPHNPGRTHMQV